MCVVAASWGIVGRNGKVTLRKSSVDVCAHGGIVVTETLVCARQRPLQFPLRPYSPRHCWTTESGFGDDFEPWIAACRSLFLRLRNGPLGCTAANPSDYTPFRHETPRGESRGTC